MLVNLKYKSVDRKIRLVFFYLRFYYSSISHSVTRMQNKLLSILILLLILISASSFNIVPEDIIRSDFKKYYDRFNVQGSFVMYSQNEDAYTYYSKEQTSHAFTPASTFKICNTLISLDSKVINDENVVIKWDGKECQNSVWNKDTNMRECF